MAVGAGGPNRSGAGLALGLVIAAGLVNYVDRSALSVAGPAIAAELKLRPGQLGVLLSAFLWAYAAAQFPVGALIDRFGSRRLLAAALALWSAAQTATGLAASLPQLIAARLALGAGEAPQFPVGARVVRSWFAPAARGIATGGFNSVSTLGPAIAPPLVAALIVAIGWRGAFVATGLAGLAVAAVWVALFRDPPAPSEPPTARAPWAALLRAPTLWAMALGNAGSGYMNWFYAAWLPGYLMTERHLTLPQAGWAASVPYLFGFAGSLAGGLVCDRLQAAGFSAIASRKVPIVAGLVIGAVFTGLTILAATSGVAVAEIAVALFFANAAGASIWALAVAVAPAEGVASVGAVQNTGGLVGGALAPVVTGVFVEATHSFAAALGATALAALAGAAVYAFGVRRPISA